MRDFKQIVKEGYNTLAKSYRSHFELSHSTQYYDWLNCFLQNTPPSGRILELGCGDGIPVAQYLSRKYTYLGIDISPVQIELARKNVPEACFEVADMTELDFPEGYFCGIVALYSIIHVPLPQQLAFISAMHRWLMADSCVMCIVGTKAWTGTEENWLIPGTSMYWSHADRETYFHWFTSTGFSIVDAQTIPEGNTSHTLLIAKKNP